MRLTLLATLPIDLLEYIQFLVNMTPTKGYGLQIVDMTAVTLVRSPWTTSHQYLCLSAQGYYPRWVDIVATR